MDVHAGKYVCTRQMEILKPICIAADDRLPNKPDEHDQYNKPLCLHMCDYPRVCGSVCVCLLKLYVCAVPQLSFPRNNSQGCTLDTARFITKQQEVFHTDLNLYISQLYSSMPDNSYV